MTGALLGGSMAMRAKAALSKVTAMPVGDSEVQRFERSAAIERLERLEQMF
jgi:hypothetical protein